MTPELRRLTGLPALPLIAISHPATQRLTDLRLTASLGWAWLATTETTALARRGALAHGACFRAVAAVSCMAAGGGWELGCVGLCVARGVVRAPRRSQRLYSWADVFRGGDRRLKVPKGAVHGR